MADAESIEAPSREPPELEGQEVMPNAPQWLFDPSVPEAERGRFIDDIVAALKTVYDPEIPCDIYELGLIYKVDIGDDRLVKIDMTLTAPGCPVASELTRSIETAVGAVAGRARRQCRGGFRSAVGPGTHVGRSARFARHVLIVRRCAPRPWTCCVWPWDPPAV